MGIETALMGIVYALIALAIGCLIGAVFLRAAVKWVESWDVPFGEAYAIVFMSWGISMGVGFLLQLIVVAMPAVQFLSFPIGLLVQAGVISWRLSVTFGKALLISLVMSALSIAILGIAAFIAFTAIRDSPLLD
ncbi:MAG: hypothetical protein ACYSTF_04475 [Planctomycetota bacterium]|jgi:hypothetical protein